MTVSIRTATLTEVPTLSALVILSARELSQGYYTHSQTEAAITHVFGVDTDLVKDGSYFVAEIDGKLAGCGGWSARSGLFGGDNYAERTTDWLDPATQPAKIRAFFVAPDYARRGVGGAILDAGEEAARAAGFTGLELMATLPGVPFYATKGFIPKDKIELDLDGILVPFVPMHKQLPP